MKEINYEMMLFNRAQGMLKAHGIVAIVFGSLGVVGFLFGLLFVVQIAIFAQLADAVGAIALAAAIFVLFTIPHVYLIISGAQLVRTPSPKLAKTLVIINLVIGVFWNHALLILAIINLTQIGDYERHYKK